MTLTLRPHPLKRVDLIKVCVALAMRGENVTAIRLAQQAGVSLAEAKQWIEEIITPAAVEKLRAQRAAGSAEPKRTLPFVAASAPHWIVVCMSRRREEPQQRQAGNGLFFRHPTREAAEAEARRLAAKHPGRRFSVYGSGESFKVETRKEATDA